MVGVATVIALFILDTGRVLSLPIRVISSDSPRSGPGIRGYTISIKDFSRCGKITLKRYRNSLIVIDAGSGVSVLDGAIHDAVAASIRAFSSVCRLIVPEGVRAVFELLAIYRAA